MLGVTQGPATIFLTGPSALQAGSLARLVPGVEVVAAHEYLSSAPQEEGVSRMVCRPGIPFFSATFMGVALSGTQEDKILLEALRVLSPSGQIAILEPLPGNSPLLKESGLEILMDGEEALVAKKKGGQTPQLVTLRGP
jgi:hypothetical protein